jgi:hypothetical protein
LEVALAIDAVAIDKKGSKARRDRHQKLPAGRIKNILAVLDDAIFGAATEVAPISPHSPIRQRDGPQTHDRASLRRL